MDSSAWDERYAASELVWSAGPNQFVEQALRDLAPGDAVDVAAGEGRNALWLAERGWRVTAVDFSARGLAKGQQAERSRPATHLVDWVHADVLTWPGLAEPAFDLALIAYLQVPADERRTAVRRAFGALRPGGTLFLVAHDITNLVEGTGGPQDPRVLMTVEDVLGDLAGEEYAVVRAERVAREVEPEHGGEPGLTAWDCLVHLTRR